MVKLLHLADVHLSGVLHAPSEALRRALRTSRRTAFRRAVDFALREGVHAVLLAGDLFDDRRLDWAAEQFLMEHFRRLDDAGIPCFYATGCADPGGARYKACQIEWPPSLHLFSEPEPEAVVLEDRAGEPIARVVGAGVPAPDAQVNLAEAFPEAEGALPHVGLLHAHLASAEGAGRQARCAPATPEALRRAGYAYWALGHVHRRQEAAPDAHAWYAGPLQGARAEESGPGGGLLVTLEGEAPPAVAFQPFASLAWADVRLDGLRDIRTQHGLLERARQGLGASVANRSEADAWAARFRLAGTCPMAGRLQAPDERARLERFLADRLDLTAAQVRPERLTRPLDPDDYRDEPHVLGEALALIDEARTHPETRRALAPEALAPEALAASPGDPAAYLQALLEDLDREACDRLLSPSE